MPSIIERLTSLENLVSDLMMSMIKRQKLVENIKLLIEQRFFNGLALEDAMAGLYRDLSIKEMRRTNDPNAIEPGVKYSLSSLSSVPSPLERTFSDTTLEPTSPQSGFLSPSEDRRAAAVTQAELEPTLTLEPISSFDSVSDLPDPLATSSYDPRDVSPRTLIPKGTDLSASLEPTVPPRSTPRGGALKRRKKKGKKRRTNRR